MIRLNSAKKVCSQSIWYFDLPQVLCYWILTSDTDHSHDFNSIVRNTDYEISIKLKYLLPGIKERIVTSPSDKSAVLHIMQNGEICLISMKLCGWKGCTSGHIWVSEVKTLSAIRVFRSPGSFTRAPLLPGSWNMAVIELKTFQKKWKYYDSQCLCCLSYLNFSLFMLIKNPWKSICITRTHKSLK